MFQLTGYYRKILTGAPGTRWMKMTLFLSGEIKINGQLFMQNERMLSAGLNSRSVQELYATIYGMTVVQYEIRPRRNGLFFLP